MRFGQFFCTRSQLPPMPPEVTSTAPARISKSPTTVREDVTPRATSVGSRTAPRTPVATPSVTTTSSTRCRKAGITLPRSIPSRTMRSKISTSPGPVPQVRWNRGTELPWPVGP